MAEKKIKTRIQQKHDIEANWIKATSFIPLAGEMIVYDAETSSTDLTGTNRTSPITYERFKIGDGKTVVSSLPFATNQHDHDDKYYTESEVDTKLSTKAPTSHASSGTTYGASSASNYGHAKASSTTPKANGTAAVGSETSSFARGDHVHPTDTTRAAAADLTSHTGNTTVHITATERTNWNAAKTHADSAHAPSDAEKNVQSDWSVTDTSSDAYIKNKPTIPTVNNATLTIQKNGTTVNTFTANSATDVTANITVPTKVSELTNDSGFTKVTVDSALSSTSTNPVQNKVIKAALDGKANTHGHPYLPDTTTYAGSDSAAGPANQVAVKRATKSILTIACEQALDTEAIWFGGSDGVTIAAMPETYCICNIKKGNNHRTLIDCYSLVNGKHWINGNQKASTTGAESWTGWKLQASNTFSNIKVGSTTVAADSATDTLEFAGSNVTLTPDATNDKITIGITKANVTSALGYTPADTTEATASKAGLMSATDKDNLDTIVDSFNSDDADTTINTIKEVLKAFENAPEGTNIANALAGKSNVGHTHEVTTKNAAPHTHTHSVTVSGTTGANSGSAVTVATGSVSSTGGGATVATGASGTATVLKGVKASGTDTFLKSINAGSGSLTSDTTSTNGIKYVESINSTAVSATGTAKAGSEDHTHALSYTKPTGVSLGSNTTATGGIQYIEDVTHSAASLTGTKTFNTDAIKSVTLAPSDTSTDGPVYVQSISGTAPSLGGTKTFVTSVTTGSGSLTAYDAATGGTEKVANGTRIPVITSLSKSGYTPAGTVSLADGTAPSMGNATTKYLSASASGTAVGANGTGSVAPSGHTHSVTVSGTTGVNSGTAVKAVTGYSSFSGGSLGGTKTFNTDAIKAIGGTKNYGFSSSTSNVMYSPTVTDGVLSWSTASAATQDAHTGTAASTGTVTFTAASLGTASTADVAPAAHTHSYGSSTAALTTSGNSGTAVTALTGVKVTSQPTITLTANTSNATGRITYVEAQGSFSAGTTPKASASFTGTNSTAVVTGGTTYYLNHAHTSAKSGGNGTVTISGGDYTATPKYMKATGNAAGTGTVGINGGSISKATKYFHPSITTETATATTGAPSATTTFVTGVTGGATTATTKYLHHTHTGASANASASAVTAVAADGTTTAVTGISTSKLVTATAAPNSHTHSYGSSTALTTGNNSGSAVAAVTAVSASTN